MNARKRQLHRILDRLIMGTAWVLVGAMFVLVIALSWWYGP